MIAVFQSAALFDTIRPNLVSGTMIGSPTVSIDGRVAICHPFADEDLAQLQATAGVTLVDELPADWQYPESDL
ncbi:MAG: hypothetical protein HPY66_1659 [Firmicutes bacterium]|nr:hypothetical protein [Bacillota bacterium]